MKKTFLFLTSILFALSFTSAWASPKSCAETLLDPPANFEWNKSEKSANSNSNRRSDFPRRAFQGESQYYYMDSLDFSYEHRQNLLTNARNAVQFLGQKLGCESNEIMQKRPIHKDTCLTFPGKSKKDICVLERETGIFIFSKDYLDGTSLLYERWD